MAELPADVSAAAFLQSVRLGVDDAVWRMITNATDMPTADFYDFLKQGVAEGIERAASPSRDAGLNTECVPIAALDEAIAFARKVRGWREFDSPDHVPHHHDVLMRLEEEAGEFLAKHANHFSAAPASGQDGEGEDG